MASTKLSTTARWVSARFLIMRCAESNSLPSRTHPRFDRIRAAATAQAATPWPRGVRGRSRRLVTLPYDVVAQKTYSSVRGTVERLSVAAGGMTCIGCSRTSWSCANGGNRLRTKDRLKTKDG